tara:strand:+ start:16887 stop:17603 length:717 start_codon:yes stop_codon:yes gene_type:complete
MLLKRTSLEDKLRREKQRNLNSQSLIKEVYKVIQDDADHNARVHSTLTENLINQVNDFKFDLLDTNKIYHINQIKKICIDYRLRFLDATYFKGKIPQNAISKIKKIEKDHETEIKNFKIIAPSRLFKLEDKDDPLLFAPLGNNYFYLIHKWGNDLHPMRKFLMWPFKSIINLLVLVVITSYLLTLMIPSGLFSKSSTTAEFLIMNFFMFKTIAAIVIYYSFAQSKNFNPAIWNSKYFN